MALGSFTPTATKRLHPWRYEFALLPLTGSRSPLVDDFTRVFRSCSIDTGLTGQGFNYNQVLEAVRSCKAANEAYPAALDAGLCVLVRASGYPSSASAGARLGWMQTLNTYLTTANEAEGANIKVYGVHWNWENFDRDDYLGAGPMSSETQAALQAAQNSEFTTITGQFPFAIVHQTGLGPIGASIANNPEGAHLGRYYPSNKDLASDAALLLNQSCHARCSGCTGISGDSLDRINDALAYVQLMTFPGGITDQTVNVAIGWDYPYGGVYAPALPENQAEIVANLELLGATLRTSSLVKAVFCYAGPWTADITQADYTAQIEGFAAGFIPPQTTALDTGHYVLTGGQVTLLSPDSAALNTGHYIYTGKALTGLPNEVVTLETGHYTLGGKDLRTSGSETGPGTGAGAPQVNRARAVPPGAWRPYGRHVGGRRGRIPFA